MKGRTHKVRSPGRRRGPSRWTPIEIGLIVVSLALIAFPLYVEAFRWVSPTGVPAASRQQEAPTATAFGGEDLVVASPEAVTDAPADLPTEQPAQPTDAPTAAPATAEQPDTRARETLTPVPTEGPTNTPGGPTDVPTATTVPPTATEVPTAPPGSTATTAPTSTTGPTATTAPTGGPTETPTITTTPPPGEPDLALVKSASVSSASPGESFTFAVTVFTNLGSSDTIQVRDVIDSQLEITSATSNSGSCSVSSNTVVCDVTAVRNSPASINITVRVRSDATPGSTLRNQASAQDQRQSTAASDVVLITVGGGVIPGSTLTPVPSGSVPTATSIVPGQTAVPATATSGTGGGGGDTGGGGGGDTGGGGGDTGGGGGDTGGNNDNNGGGVVSSEPPALLPPTPIEAGPLPPTPRPARPPATGGGGTSAARTATALPRTAGPTSTTSPATVTPVVNTSDGVFFTLASDWGSAFPGQNVRYTIAARNGKTDLALREVVISIGLASNVELTGKPVSDRGDPEVSGNRVIMRLNELTTGQGIEIGIPVRIKSDVAVGTRIVAQAEMTYRGLSTPIYSNIVPILIVGQAQQATATALPSATATVATTATAPAATATATAAATATSTPLATATPGAVATATRGTTGVQPSNPPGTVTQLPETSSGVPISGLALLGLTLLTRTFRLHRAQDRI